MECIRWQPDSLAIPVRPVVLKDAGRSCVAFIHFASPTPKLLDFIGGSTGSGSTWWLQSQCENCVCVVQGSLVYPA